MLNTQTIQRHLDNLTKPPGSLGRLEEIAAKLCYIQQSLEPETSPRNIVLFAADHGVINEKVSVWPSEVTELMIDNILAGGAASSVLAKLTQTKLKLVDVGSFAECRKQCESYRFAQVSKGTGNLACEPAMTKKQFEKAIDIGRQEAEESVNQGAKILAAGEMGIGNTTAASCIAALLCDLPTEKVVGRGAGADDKILNKKIQVVSKAISRTLSVSNGDLIEDIASVCGFEIAAMAGFYLKAVELKTTIVVDGFISTSAALIAERLKRGACEYMIASHCSAEPGHKYILEKLELDPLLNWSMRLGEGTGALLVMPLLDAAVEITVGMATFESVGIKQ